MREFIAILDFGSQYLQLIARRVRENRVYCEIVPHSIGAKELARRNPKGLILSGGPASVYGKGAPECDPGIFALGIPVLGICYGMQLGARVLGGSVTPARSREYGHAEMRIASGSHLFDGIPRTTSVWMSHGDVVSRVSRDFSILASTRNTRLAAVKHNASDFYGVQFHPEVAHTPAGQTIFANFLRRICRCKEEWTMRSYIPEAISSIRKKVGKDRVICAVSGGVDSTVVAALLHLAVGKRSISVFVDNGLLRKGEVEGVRRVLRGRMGINLQVVDAAARFLKKLAGVGDPERKRKIVGHEFIEVFKKKAGKIRNMKYLAQGTLYPDVIESASSHGGPSATIKTHHNVGGLPRELGFKLIEPLRFLFKDEVREMGKELGLPDEIVWRQPFPGPGLAVRVVGEVTPQRVEVLRNADEIVMEEMREAGLERSVWQSFAVLLPVNTVGVMGDQRTYENVVALRVVQSTDGMTADWVDLPHELLRRISNRVINEVKGVNRVVYDVSSKPPSTIEWE